jgi:hypothetical protein
MNHRDKVVFFKEKGKPFLGIHVSRIGMTVSLGLGIDDGWM